MTVVVENPRAIRSRHRRGKASCSNGVNDAPITRLLLPVRPHKHASTSANSLIAKLSPQYRTDALFIFHASLRLAIGHQTRIVKVAVNGEREEVVPVPSLEGAIGWPDPGNRAGDAMAYRLKRCFRVAEQALPEHVGAVFQDEGTARSQRAERELHRIRTYYDELMAAAFVPMQKVYRSMATVAVYADLSKDLVRRDALKQQLEQMQVQAQGLEADYNDTVAQLTEERDRRLREVELRRRMTVDVRLVRAALLVIPQSH